jgi:hypothetical protein
LFPAIRAQFFKIPTFFFNPIFQAKGLVIFSPNFNPSYIVYYKLSFYSLI